MDKKNLILKYFQKKDQLKVENKEYQKTLTTLFKWLTDNDKVTDDKTSKLFPNKTCTAQIISKDKGIIAGIEEIEFLLKKYTRLSFRSHKTDGQKFKEKDTIATISGKSYEILAYERTILNILQRMSGISTETSSLISLISPISQIQISATRKTPWMSLDKKAVAVGGGLTHRLNLSDGILIKDNHLALISKAVKTPRGWQADPPAGGEALTPPMVEGQGQLIEIEVESEDQAHQVIETFKSLKDTSGVFLRGSPDGGGTSNTHLAILLDNFTPARVKSLLSNLGNVTDIIFEASGGITQENIKDWSQTGVDIISIGALTHSSRAVNFSLDMVTK